MAYDARDGYTVLYGGMEMYPNFTVVLDDTWAYLGGRWSQQSVAGPVGGRADASMAYDPADGYVVLFGGSSNRPDGCEACNDTWTFSDGQWTALDIPGPPPRYAASFAWDPALGEMILFGGLGCHSPIPWQGVCGDTWSYRHGEWNVLSSAGPAARDGASLEYVPAAGGLLLFGGYDASYKILGDTWLFDGNWTHLALAGPAGRTFAVQSEEPTAGDGVLFGGGKYTLTSKGLDFGVLNETWLSDGTAWQAVAVSGPPPRMSSAIVYDAADGYVLLFGGLWACSGPGCAPPDGNPLVSLGDTWSFSLGPIAPEVTVFVVPTAVCILEDRSCAAQTWQAEVNVSVGVTYATEGVASLAAPRLIVLPWGKVQLDPTSPPLVSCRTVGGDRTTCDGSSSLLAVGGASGFELNWSSNPNLDALYVGDHWTVQFGITVAGPPYGSVPVYACATAECLAGGSGNISGRFSELAFQPLRAGVSSDDSLPYANITVDPPRLANGASSLPPVANPPPPPAAPIGLPLPISVPNPGPLPAPILAALVTVVPTVSVSAIAAGVLSAGFSRAALQRRAVGQRQSVGNIVRPKRSAFEAERPSDTKIGRFE